MTKSISFSVGSFGVVRWPMRKSEGSLCQNEAVDSGLGRLAMILNICFIKNEDHNVRCTENGADGTEIMKDWTTAN